MLAGRIATATLLALGLVAPARGDATSKKKVRRACQAAYDDARDAEAEGQLLQAKRHLRACAQKKCGVFLEHQCTRRYGQLDADTPSVVPIVLDDGGTPVTTVTVRLDGVVLASELDGHALPVDPGVHEFSFEIGDEVFARRKMMILQGQRNLPLRASLPSDEPDRPERPIHQAVAASPPKRRPSPMPEPRPTRERSAQRSSVAGYLLLGTGLVGLGGAGVLTYWGRKDNELLAGCSPDCSPQSVAHIRRLYLAADVSLGAGVAALVAGAWLTWGRSDPVVEILPGPGGATANLRGAF